LGRIDVQKEKVAEKEKNPQKIPVAQFLVQIVVYQLVQGKNVCDNLFQRKLYEHENGISGTDLEKKPFILLCLDRGEDFKKNVDKKGHTKYLCREQHHIERVVERVIFTVHEKILVGQRQHGKFVETFWVKIF